MKSRTSNGSTGLEFLRFGSSIPGSYWGCCACDIIQNFKVDPDAKASIQIVGGDGGQAIGDVFAGPTYRDIFHQRLRFGTFGSNDMPNHAFIAILTQWQITSGVGKKWLAILKEAGFEFVRTVNNSVYSGANLGKPTGSAQNNDNYIFMLVRNIGAGGLKDQFQPPKEWLALPSAGKTETWDFVSKLEKDGVTATEQNHAADTAIWNKIGKAKLLTRAAIEKAGAPVMLGGARSEFPQETAASRDAYYAGERAKIDAVVTANKLSDTVKTQLYGIAGIPPVAATPSLKGTPTANAA